MDDAALTPPQAKRLATVTAELAIAGYEVHELRRGGFLLCRRGLTRHCPTLAHLQAAARQIGGTQT